MTQPYTIVKIILNIIILVIVELNNWQRKTYTFLKKVILLFIDKPAILKKS